MIDVNRSDVTLKGKPVVLLAEYSTLVQAMMEMLVDDMETEKDDAVRIMVSTLELGVNNYIDSLDDEEDEAEEECEEDDEPSIEEALDALTEAIKRAFK